MIARRAKLLGSLLVVVAVAAGVGLYLFQPWRLFTDREVQEALPDVARPAVAVSGSPDAAAPATVPSASAAAVDRVVADGEFVTHEHDTTGRAELVRSADGRHRLLLRDLVTSDGPDLRVWLTDQAVLPGRAGWSVFDDGRWVELAPLKGNRGNQVYEIPAEVDLTGLKSVSIWCKRFSVSFGAAALQSI